MGVVGGQEARSNPGRDAGQCPVALDLTRPSLILDLDEVGFPPKPLLVPGGGLGGGFEVAVKREPRHLTGVAAGEADEPAAVLSEQLLVHARPVVEAL